MKKNLMTNKEIRFILIAFVTVTLLIIASKTLGYYQMTKMHEVTNNIYEHPLKVSNAALNVKLGLYKINRDMRNIIIAIPKDELSKEELSVLLEDLTQKENEVWKNLNIIEDNILGKDGLALQKEIKTLFEVSKVIRAKVIQLVMSDKINEAIVTISMDGNKHFSKIEKQSDKLYEYAQNKANLFIEESDKIFYDLELINIATSLLILLAIFIIIFYTISRISKYIYKNEYLNRITSIIRELDKLIVREKDPYSLLANACKILTLNDVYENAWIIIVDEDSKVEYFTCAVETKESIEFENKIQNNWLPNCFKSILSSKVAYSIYKNSIENCADCLMLNGYTGNAVFNIKLIYKEVVYGYLTITVEESVLNNSDEITLLRQFVEDISYALHNLKVQENLYLQQNIYKELFENTQSAIVVYSSYDDGKTFVISNLNTKAESIDKISKKDVLGKDVKDVFPEIEDFGLLEVFQKVYHSGVSQMFELKEYSDERISGWRENYVYKLATNDIVAVYTDKTEEKQSKEALVKLEKLYDNIINSVDNLIFAKDIDFNYIACNKAFEKFVGRTKDEIIGKTDYHFFDKDIADSFREHDEIMLKNKEVKSNFEWVIYPDGSRVYLYTTKSPLTDTNDNIFGLVGVSVDMTKQKHTEDSLELIKRRYEIAEKMGKVGSWEYDVETKEFFASNETKEIYGFPIEAYSFTTQEFQSCIPEKKRVHQALVNLIDKGESYNLEFEINPFNGSDSKIISSIAKVEFDENSKAQKVIGFIQDITEMKQKDEILINQSRNAAMGEMISMIAHQWRQPLSVIAMDANNMIVDIALEDYTPEKVQEYCESILEQTQHLSETINDFRNYFKPDKDLTYIMLSKIIDETYAIVKDSLTNNGIEFKSSYESSIEVGAFERELMQVFVNIINNSKDVLISNNVENPLISVRVYDDENYVNTEICDNGGGIDISIKDKIFDPYFTTKDEMSGTGLGLYMSKMIVEEHLNGIIETHNCEDGACFIVRLLKKSILKDDGEGSHE